MKKYWKMVSLLLILAFLISMLATGCGRQKQAAAPGGKTTITFWHTFNNQEQATLSELIKEFEAQNPDIAVEVQAVPYEAAQNKFKIAAQAGQAPDVMRAEIQWTVTLAALGYLTPLDSFIKPDDKEDYLSAPFATNVYKGKIWGIPQVTDALGLLYNKRMLKDAGVEVPKTTDDFVKVAQKLTDKQKGVYGFITRGDSYWLQPFIYSFGGMLMDANDKSIQINSPNSVRGLQFVVDLKEKYGVIPQEIDFANDYTNMQAGFKTGKYAMILNGPWAINDLLSGPEFKDPDNLGIAPIPAGPEGQSGTLVGGHNYVISSNTKNAAAAYKFIEFLNSKESQVKFAVKNNLLPTRKSAYQVDAIKNNRIISDFKQVIDKGVNRPVIPEAANFWENFHPSYQAALKGVKTPQEALDEVAAAWNKLLKGQ